jgi:hypothetical protein
MSTASATLDFRLISNWLGLPAGPWPPDHYTLLGLKPGEVDCARIEHSVHERLMRIRSYQLTHPALATEAMTRLAKAFDCLTNQDAKKAYDQTYFPHLAVAAPLASSRTPTTIANDTAATTPAPATPPAPVPVWWTEVPRDWQAAVAPPPVRQAGTSEINPPPVRLPPAPVEPAPTMGEEPMPPPVRATPSAEPAPTSLLADLTAQTVSQPAAPESSAVLPPIAAPRLPFDPLVESIRSSGAVRRGIELRRGLYERVLWLRRLQRAWDRAGRYLQKPKRRLAKLAEESDLAHVLLSIEDLLQEAPAALGEPGQPGYRVVALATQEPVVERFKALDDHDRALLARDWVSGRELLAAYRRFLRQQILVQRHLTGPQRLRRRIDALLTDHLVAVLIVLGVLAILVLIAIYFWR